MVVLIAVISLLVLLFFVLWRKRLKNQTQLPSSRYEEDSHSGGFWSFRRFVTPSIITVLYPLGALILTIMGIKYAYHFGLSDDQNLVNYDFTGAFGYAVGFLIGANLAWRVVCEAAVVLFSIHDRLAPPRG